MPNLHPALLFQDNKQLWIEENVAAQDVKSHTK